MVRHYRAKGLTEDENRGILKRVVKMVNGR